MGAHNLDKIRQYWEDPKTISLIDTNLRYLEESIALPYLKKYHDFADFGCGDGISTVNYARRVKTCLALEQSNYLFSKALERFKAAGLANIKTVKGSVLELSDYCDAFDVVVTQRALINLPSWKHQMRAIKNIYSSLKTRGCYIMIEDTFEGHSSLNNLRRSVGLPDIPMHWHNLFFYHDKLVDFLKSLFIIKRHHTFDLYYLLTRVYVNMFANFEGYGIEAKKDDIFNLADPQAAKLFKIIGGSIRINKKYAFGPVQGFILRKK